VSSGDLRAGLFWPFFGTHPPTVLLHLIHAGVPYQWMLTHLSSLWLHSGCHETKTKRKQNNENRVAKTTIVTVTKTTKTKKRQCDRVTG
jgi:hypothetical protein